MKRIAGGLAALALLLAGCGSSVDAPAAERAFLNSAGGQSIKSMCDAAKGSWQCFYDGVEAKSDYLVVKLTTDAGADVDTLAAKAGTAWFNFIHCDFPDLDTIVVNINGIGHNVQRGDTNADLISC